MKENHLISSYERTIQQMEDKKLLLLFQKRGDYNNDFLKLAEEEATKRGYDYQNIKFEDVDTLVFQHKTTEELVNIVSGGINHYDRSDIRSAVSELKKREYDLSSLYFELENKRKMRPRGNVGGYMFSINGIGTTLYGREEQDDGSYFTTEWITFFWIPLLPIGSYHVLDWDSNSPFRTNYEMRKIPFKWKQISKIYLIIFSFILLIALSVFLFTR